MNFATTEFWTTLALCLVASRLLLWILRRIHPAATAPVAKWSLFATAMALLFVENWLTAGAFLWVVIAGWCSLCVIDSRLTPLVRKALLAALLVLQLAPLFYYKYWNFLFHEVLGITSHIPSVLIPMGLSFYTFQTIGFWVDSIRHKSPTPRFIDYLNFASFFPQIVAGPIERRDDLLPQIRDTRYAIHWQNLQKALPWIVLGLSYKLIVADNIALESAKFLVNPANPWHVWLECITFGIRIYFDFAGYSFVAIGLGLLFGVHLTLNFRIPYLSENPREFWRNWHITLGSWLRDYIYLPMGGSRVRWWAFNLLFVFLVSGIWHGAGWGFLVWGLLHGIGVALSPRASLPRALRFVSIGLTYLFCNALWLFFYETDPALMWRKAQTLLSLPGYLSCSLPGSLNVFSGAGNQINTLFVLAVAAALLAVEAIGVFRAKEPYHYLRKEIPCLVLVALTVWLGSMAEAPFIYFHF